MNSEIKKQIREYNKCKRQMRKGTQERRDINKKIRELKAKDKKETTPEKEELIKLICKREPWWEMHKGDLYKFTVEQLKRNIEFRKNPKWTEMK
jgi:predicted nuclease with TOPRIM domain